MESQKAEIRLSVSEFVDIVNQTFEYALPTVVIVGEVSGYNVRQNKWVRFKLKDQSCSVDFFGSVFQVRTPLEDGMTVAVVGRPRLSDKYGFSVSIQSVLPVGEGTIKRSFDLLKKKLHAEGLFDESRKRILPAVPERIGLISSTQSAGYADFIKVLNERFGGMRVEVAHTLVQGVHAPGQIIRAIEHFNQMAEPPEVIVVVRGGGDADDLAAFNDEGLVRAIAGSRIPTLVGVGHEIDTTLADLAADVRASTPSNAAQLLVPDRREIIERVITIIERIEPTIRSVTAEREAEVYDVLDDTYDSLAQYIHRMNDETTLLGRLVQQYDPKAVLSRGYAIVRGDVSAGNVIEVERSKDIITAEVQHVSKK